VEDHARGIALAALKGKAGQAYNLGAGEERANIDIVKTILGELKQPESLIRYVTDRPAHDRRYALDVNKAKAELGFSADTSLEAGLSNTVTWYREHAAWLESVLARKEEGGFGLQWYTQRLQQSSTEQQATTLAPHHKNG